MEKEKLINISIKRETWTALNIRRTPGETWDEILNRFCLEEPPIKKKAKKK